MSTPQRRLAAAQKRYRRRNAIRIPTRFYDDHVNRDLPAPTVVDATDQHYWIDSTSEHLGELLCCAEFYRDHVGFCNTAGLRRSATATVNAIRAHLLGL